MYKKHCPICGRTMVKNGFTSAKKQRWRCRICSYTTTNHYDSLTKDFLSFMSYLFGRGILKDKAGQGRQFRRRIAKFWELWPLPPVTDKRIEAVFCDGIWLSDHVVVLIVVANTHKVIGWSAAPSERSSSWLRLLNRIDPPRLCVCDGGRGFIAAASEVWKQTRIQRCQFHLIQNISTYTHRRAQDEASRELHELVRLWKDITTQQEARGWIYLYDRWCKRWEVYMREKFDGQDGHVHYRHQGLRKARSLIRSVIEENTLFAYIDFSDQIENYCALATNNYIEGAVNSQLKEMLHRHKGMSLIHRLKACYWWLYEHTEDPLPIRRLMQIMPTDNELETLMHPKQHQKLPGSPDEWGSSLVWDELRHALPYRGYIG